MSDVLKVVTHNGVFHPDDVFSAAVLQKVFPGIEITRTRDPAVIDMADIVFDVGRIYDPQTCRFDHHQPGAPVRENGIAYSAFGLIWMEYGKQYCDGDPRLANAVDQRLVQVIDANDNGTQLTTTTMSVPPFEIFDVLFQLNPLPRSNEAYDVQYAKAVKLGGEILQRLVQAQKAELAMREYFSERVKHCDDPRYVVLDDPGDYKTVASEYSELLYFVSPDTANNTWGVTAVPTQENMFQSKAPFPQAWAGLEGKQLSTITGIPDAIFCHLKRFYAVAESQKGALELLNQALNATDAL